jgi:hypothetical protein
MLHVFENHITNEILKNKTLISFHEIDDGILSKGWMSALAHHHTLQSHCFNKVITAVVIGKCKPKEKN